MKILMRSVPTTCWGKLQIDASDRLKTMSKGTKEKSAILVMSRHADLYILDEPIAGVDPATHAILF